MRSFSLLLSCVIFSFLIQFLCSLLSFSLLLSLICHHYFFNHHQFFVKSSSILQRNFLVKISVFCVFIFCFRFAYVIKIRGESCDVGDFRFFSVPDSFNFAKTTIIAAVPSAAVVSTMAVSDGWKNILYTSKNWRKSVQYYSTVFQDLIAEGFLSPESKSLCVDTPLGQEVLALKELGISDAVGVSKTAAIPLVVAMKNSSRRQPFENNTFDFVFYGGGERIDNLSKFEEIAVEKQEQTINYSMYCN